MLLYSTATNALSWLMQRICKKPRKDGESKFIRFVRGQRHIIDHVRDTYSNDEHKPVVWVHAASLGEYAIARPLLAAFKSAGMQTVMTFFSPTGYEAVAGRANDIDHLYYLPFDTHANAQAFLDTIKPDKAVFIVSEYWHNYLEELHKRRIDTYLVSAHITEKSVFYKWYGSFYRKCLKSYKKIFTVDHESMVNLSALGYPNAQETGNPLFDNAIAKASEHWDDPIIKRFTEGKEVFIAGSIHDDHDLKMVTDLANAHPDVRFLMVPHEIGSETVTKIKSSLQGKAIAYSECDDTTDLGDTQSLIIDFVGALAYIYRYAQWAYVGGGFTPYLHSLLEATVYGVPVAFGPMVHRKVTPTQISERGIGCIVHDSQALERWWTALRSDPKRMTSIRAKAKAYVAQNSGSAARIAKEIMDK